MNEEEMEVAWNDATAKAEDIIFNTIDNLCI